MTAEDKTKKEETKESEKESQAKPNKAQKSEVKKETKPEEETKKTEVKEKSGETKVTKSQAEDKKAVETEVEAEEPKIELTKKAKDIVKTIESMTVLELSTLVKALEEKFGVTAAPAAIAASAGVALAGAGTEPPAEEKTTFNAVLSAIGDKKIQVIKEIRAITNLGLKEAKDLVEQAPKPIKEGIPKEEAEEIKKKLETVGATVELK